MSEFLNITSDVDDFEQMVKLIDDAGTAEAKIDLLQDFYVKFEGDFLPWKTECEWILTTRQDYRRRYLDKMSLMLQLLHDKGEYTSTIRYANDLLKKYPHSVEIRYWQAVSLWEIRKPDEVKNTLDAAKEIFMDYEWEMFTDFLDKHHEDQAAKKYIKDCINDK